MIYRREVQIEFPATLGIYYAAICSCSQTSINLSTSITSRLRTAGIPARLRIFTVSFENFSPRDSSSHSTRFPRRVPINQISTVCGMLLSLFQCPCRPGDFTFPNKQQCPSCGDTFGQLRKQSSTCAHSQRIGLTICPISHQRPGSVNKLQRW